MYSIDGIDEVTRTGLLIVVVVVVVVIIIIIAVTACSFSNYLFKDNAIELDTK